MTTDDIDRHEHAGTITQLQAEVLRFRIQGLSHRKIALGLGKAPETIRHHEQAALRRIANTRRRRPAA